MYTYYCGCVPAFLNPSKYLSFFFSRDLIEDYVRQAVRYQEPKFNGRKEEQTDEWFQQ